MTSLVEAAEMAMAAFDAVKETAAEAEAEATAAVHGLLKSATCEGWPEVDFCREIAEGLYDVGLAVATEALVRSRALYLVGDDGGRGPHSLSGRAHNITCRALAAFYLEVGARN